VIVLDLEMPEMDGIEFLKERKRLGIEIPVIILSSIARRGAQITMEALSLGASDFITKPSGSESEDIHVVEKTLVEMVRAYGSQYRRSHGLNGVGTTEVLNDRKPRTAERMGEKNVFMATVPENAAEPAVSPVARKDAGPVEILAIGISTGGPNALRKVFAEIDPDFPLPVVVVQHMPAGFTTEFAKSLDRICPLEVKEAEEGDLLKTGRILICPGNYHIEVEKRRLAGVVRLNQKDTVNGHRPSADVLFASVAEQYGGRSIALIMTGMGRDGAREIGSIHRKGGITIGQDAASSIVYGMPRVAAEMGHVQHIVALEDIAETLNRLARENA
jgi:two-component system chemotaxis response regulator CheB